MEVVRRGFGESATDRGVAIMDTRRRVEELASRCVSLVIYHQHTHHRPRPMKARIVAEVRDVMAEAKKGGISPATLSAEVLSELNARYDPETARRLHVEFIGGPDDLPIGLVLA
jgi:hypothetical protein